MRARNKDEPIAVVAPTGQRLKAFRVERKLGLRIAASQLHISHVTLNDWELGLQIPAPAYRLAIEVWTSGEIKPADWPMSLRDREIAANAALVTPCVAPKASDAA